MEGESDASTQHQWCIAGPEHLLQPHRHPRSRRIRIIDRQPRTGRSFEVRRCQLIETLSLTPVEKTKQRSRDIESPKLPPRANATERIMESAQERVGQSNVRHVGPDGIVSVQEGDSLSELPRAVAPVKDFEAFLLYCIGDCSGNQFRIWIFQRHS